ncbi:MAG: DUF4032 domain-containing protein [Acidimicrobiia bacterium]|nr:DUF4032 domain-containing protein [Acidimicrobiia bacterium]
MPPELTIRAGHPDFLELPWDKSLADWELDNIVELPKGISRHEVRFLQYPQGLYAIKELPTRAARQDYTVLRTLEAFGGPAVRPVGLVERRHSDRHSELSAALITAYEPFSFSYRELVQGPGFGARRNQMLDAFAGLLVELHLAGVYWGDCSLSNVLYRFDAEAIETVMVDAETAEVYGEDRMTDGRRTEDIEIMIINVAGGMADIAAANGIDLDDADLALGEDIADRYYGLWEELSAEPVIRADERYQIRNRIARLNDLGFNVEEVDLIPVDDGGSRLKLKLKVGGRTFHMNRLKELTGIEALEHQARQLLSDLYYFQANEGVTTPTGKNVAAVRWRVSHYEPIMERLRQLEGVIDPIQAYCDLLVHRYVMSEGLGHDVGTEAAFDDWLERGRPGYPLVSD